MIQRIQTLYLLVAALVSGGLIFVFSLWTEISGQILFANDLMTTASVLTQTIFYTYIIFPQPNTKIPDN